MNLKLVREESGQVVVVTFFSLIMLLGFVALAVDVGLLFNAKRKVQIAADAGAIAAAMEAQYGKIDPATAARAAAGNNGITDTTNQVTVNNGPSAGWHTGSGFYEVIVNQPNATTFMGLFIPGKIGVSARAVAGVVGSPACFFALNDSAADALTIKGSGAIYAPNCGGEINSNSPQAICITGNGNTLDTPFLRFRASSIATKGSCNKLPSTPYYTNDQQISDPLKGLQGPSIPSDCNNTWDTKTQGSTISLPNSTLSGWSGTTCFIDSSGKGSGVTFTGIGQLGASGGVSTFVFQNGAKVATGAQVTVPNGTFVIEGADKNFSLQGGPSCSGSTPNGVGLEQDSSSSLNIYAPQTGAYSGIALMQPSPPSGPATVQPPLEMQFGSNGTYKQIPSGTACQTVSTCSDNKAACGALCGLIYAPDAQVYLHDNGGGVTATGLIADTIDICSSQLSIESYNYAPGNASPLNSVALVE